MKFTEISRTATAGGEVLSTYNIGNLTVHLTSRFNNKVTLEDAMYQLALQRLRSQNKSERGQREGGHFDEDVV